MTDPKRLLESGASSLETSILRSGRGGPPPADAEARLLASLGVSAGPLPAAPLPTELAAPPSVGAPLGAGVLAKSMAVGSLVVALVGAPFVVSSWHAKPAAPPVASTPAPPLGSVFEPSAPRLANDDTARLPSDEAPAATSAPRRHGSPAAPLSAKPALVHADAAQAPKAPDLASATSSASTESPPSPAAVSVASQSPSAQTAPPSLAEEVASLDVARALLAAGHSAQALSTLDAYGQRFPRGMLALEASVLRIEALARTGDLTAARTLAEHFLAAHPQSALCERVRRAAGLESFLTVP